MANKKDKKIYIFEYNLFFISIVSILLFFIIFFLTYLIESFLYYKFSISSGLIFFDSFSKINNTFLYLIIALLWFLLHEVIHGIAYLFCGVDKKNISFGIVLEKGILYCRCNQFADKKAILISLISPFIVIGVFTYIIGYIIGSKFLVLLSILNMIGACADLSLFPFFLSRDKDVRFRELDDSSTFCLETTEDLISKKFFTVRLKKVVNNKELKELKDDKNKFINITFFSKVVLLLFLFYIIISLLSF